MRSVVITGAASGIGAALAERFARAGSRVALLDVDAEAAAERATALEARGAEVLGLGCDVTSPASCAGAIEAVEKAWGGVDVLVNNAGITHVGRVRDSCRIVLEGANSPLSSEAEAALVERNVIVIPDLIANAGGVVCSYFEQVQSAMNYYWGLSEVLGKLDVKLTEAYLDVSRFAADKRLTLRDAAMVLAVDRVAGLCRERGWL